VDHPVVPEEASLIAEGDHIAGRITSSRMSPTLRRSLPRSGRCPAGPARHRSHRTPTERRLIAATVMPQLAHVDPDGKLMRI
jgi:sarcosine oxidase subunit alpha